MAKKPKGRPAGRPTKYRAEYHDPRVRELAAEGKIEREMAERFGVDLSTLRLWAEKHPTFSLSLKDGKKLADDHIEATLFKRASGMTLPDSHVSVIENEVVVTPLVKHLPPDPTSMIFWLKCRRPKHWRDKQEIIATQTITHEVGDSVTVMMANIRARRSGTPAERAG